MTNKVTAFLLAFSLSPIHALADCRMSLGWEHVGTNTAIYKDLSGSDPTRYSVFYQAKAAINTDGAPKSYHPDDPRGARNMALNTVVNAMEPRPYDRLKGRSIPCPMGGDGGCFSEWIAAFENAKAMDFSRNARWWVRFSDIIPTIRTGQGVEKPCVQDNSSPAHGYYVSATDSMWEPGDKCDQSIYVDASQYNGNVIPGGSEWGRPGRPTDSFDLVVMMVDGGDPIYGINFDSGPRGKIGEVSIAAAAALRGKDIKDYTNYRAIVSLALKHVNYLVFPEVDIKRAFGGRFTQQQLDEYGADVFEEWGGVERLRSCGLLPQFKDE